MSLPSMALMLSSLPLMAARIFSASLSLVHFALLTSMRDPSWHFSLRASMSITSFLRLLTVPYSNPALMPTCSTLSHQWKLPHVAARKTKTKTACTMSEHWFFSSSSSYFSINSGPAAAMPANATAVVLERARSVDGPPTEIGMSSCMAVWASKTHQSRSWMGTFSVGIMIMRPGLGIFCRATLNGEVSISVSSSLMSRFCGLERKQMYAAACWQVPFSSFGHAC
mmetsp:Transcript_71098/g.179492  ORF Transcript_71098/g.179492 Transcript_71098/m.179492 type:complete len:225 (+) Transcript_71098:114-788(+)